jgi:uncharacterized membrane protein YbhN (UPF0104 family)
MYSKLALKLIVSLTFIIYVVLKFDMRSLYGALLSIKFEYYLISFLILILNSIILAQKFKTVMKPSGIYQPLHKLIKINFMCRFFSMFMTSVIGQSVIRWHISTKNQEGRFKFIAVLVFERSSFFFALFVTVGISLLFSNTANILVITKSVFPFVAVGLLAIILYYFYLNYTPFYDSINGFILNQCAKIKIELKNKIGDFFEIFGIYSQKKTIVASGLGLAFIWQFLFLLRVSLLVASIDASLTFVQVGWMASLVLLLQILPISLNGIGLRETAYAFLFRIQDLPPEKGVLLGFIIFSQMFIISIIGGVVYFLSKE